MTPTRPGGRTRRWIASRVAGALLVVVAAQAVVFLVVRLIPGDPAEAALGGPGSQASAEALAAARERLGLDRPLLVQYLSQLGALLRGDWGASYSQHRPVLTILGEQLPATLVLATLALALAWVLALLGAAVAASGSTVGRGISDLFGLVSAALPHFWLGTLGIAVFSSALAWLPPVSGTSAAGLVLPAATLAIPLAGYLGQVMRDSLDEALRSPFALAARARGEGPALVFLRHGLRHAALPGVNISAWAFGNLVSGAVVVEMLFARPGLGRTLLQAVISRDAPLITGVVVATAIGYAIVILVADLLEAAIDPRTVAA